MVEASADWWRTWFGPSYLALYDRELAQRTPNEIDQLELLLRLRPPLRILDLACGQGRHAIELARRGYQVTGLDVSPYLLEVARERAEASAVSVRWVLGDMRQPLEGDHFDLILSLFTSLGYFADPGDDSAVISAAAGMLGPGGRLFIEVVNGERILANFREREWFTVGDAAVMERRTLDRESRRMAVERTVERAGHAEINLHVIRLYGPREIESLLLEAGLGPVRLFGDWDGSPVNERSLRVLAVATKERGGS
jgi:SAM-dependent methyltransferase